MRALVVAAALVAACAHRQEPSGPPLSPEIGQTHAPFTERPAALVRAIERQQLREEQQQLVASRGDAWTARMRAPAERQKELRGLLADADALLASDQIDALPPILREVDLLLRVYPDIKAEIDELEKNTLEWEHAAPIEKFRIKRRMEDLIDLIRLQLFAAR